MNERKKTTQMNLPEQYEENTDNTYHLLGGGRDSEEELISGNGDIAALASYSYFDWKKISGSLDITASAWAEGQKHIDKGEITDIRFAIGYETYSYRDNMVGMICGSAVERRVPFEIEIRFIADSAESAVCGCSKCRGKKHSYWQEPMSSCGYTAALLLSLKEHLKTHNVGDATERDARAMLDAYHRRISNRRIAEQTVGKESILLEPHLIRKNDQLSLTFKIGTTRMFVVKKLDEFCENVKNAAAAVYGSNTRISHARSGFTEEGRRWIGFIERIAQEETEFQERLENSYRSRYYYYRRRSSIGSSINLFGWRLDEFYSILGKGTVEYEDRDAQKKMKLTLHAAEGNPSVALRIADGTPKKTKEFSGIRVSGSLPELYFGSHRAYYIAQDRFCRTDETFWEKIEPLSRFVEDDGKFSFLIGRNAMAEFYYQILPQLQEVAQVKETDPEKFHAYIPPRASIAYYLDAQDRSVSCRVTARYGEQEFSSLDLADAEYPDQAGGFRDFYTEKEALELAREWLPYTDPDNRELTCGEDEDAVYRLMSEGVPAMMAVGEVHCTNRFRNRQAVRRMKVSVGVSVVSGLLDLTVTTEDVPQDELLDILNSYRTKKKYYRLKDGSFLDLSDSSSELLAEMMDSLHVKPKEFVKGKMQLPLYRALYLNKMLEEHENIYNDRDAHFRRLIKEFKTVNDADFEVPESLSRVMRGYQKNGYKWLRTLAARNLGGILADDMGLGKTLQMIAVLLAAKQEGEKGTSLIAAPASLVFNWGEEFSRFAPELSVCLIAGTQAERREKLSAWQDYDVLVTSYDLLKRDIDVYEDKQFLYQVIDEAQYIKNHTTAAAKAVKAVKSTHRFALTGTPIENRLSELWSIFDYLMPGFLYGYETFKKEMETPIVKKQDEDAMRRLQKMTGPFILRRLKEDVLKDLPEKLEEVRYVRFNAEQQKLYDGQVVHMRTAIARQDEEEFHKNKLQILAELTRLRQICCDPSLCFENYSGEAAKLEACTELIKSAIDGGHRMLLFSQFTSMLEILEKRLKEEGIPFFTITGATPKEKRLEMVKDFNGGDVPVFLISLKAGGVGLNLTGADVVIHYDPWWNFAAQNQATDRTHRIGQTKKVTVYKLIAKGSVEEKILGLQETKRDLAEQVIGGETGGISALGREELLALLGASV